jgi:hypothetical protein
MPMLSGLFNRVAGLGEVNDAAIALADRFAKKVGKDGKSSGTQVQRAIDELVAEAKGLKRKHGWGLFKSSRLGDAVRWRLIDAGYSKDLADTIAQKMAIAATYAGDKKPAG